MDNGALSLLQLKQSADAGEVESVLAVFPDMYGRLLGKRLDASYFLDSEDRLFHACDYVLAADVEMEPVAGFSFASWEKGYGDLHFRPDLDTLRLAAWSPRTAVVVCDLFREGGEEMIQQAPRTILKKQTSIAESAGYVPMVASELEYYIFQDSYQSAFARNYRELTPLGRHRVDYNVAASTKEEQLHRAARQRLKTSGIPLEGSKGEWGIGQHELNLKFGDAVGNADRHSLLKLCLKDTADELDLSVSFMAKYRADQAGSSCHLHLSLWQDGANVFSEPGTDGLLPDLFRWFLGGWMMHVPDVMVFYAPTVNSYKRFIDGSWAPTRLSWAFDNRTVAFRVIGKGPSCRIECRIPGADCNPYLATAAALASGLDGIARRIEPPMAFNGNAYGSTDVPEIPRTLRDAITSFSAGDFASRAFGDEVAEHYLRFYSSEQSAYDRAVTDWERHRYFERV